MEVVSYWETNLSVVEYWSTRTEVHLEDAVFHLGRIIREDRSWAEPGVVAEGVIRSAITRIENERVTAVSMFTSMCDPKPGTYCESVEANPMAFVPGIEGDEFDPMAHGEI